MAMLPGAGFGWLGLQGGDGVGVCKPGIDRDGDGVRGCSARAHCLDGVNDCVAKDGFDRGGVHGHRTDGGRFDGGSARVHCVIGVDSRVTGGRINGGECGGVAGHSGAEAVCLVNLCCPVKPLMSPLTR
jgi:hypothetical protein